MRRVRGRRGFAASVSHAASSRCGAPVDYAALGTRRLPRFAHKWCRRCEQHAPAALAAIRLQQPCHSSPTPSPRLAAIAHKSPHAAATTTHAAAKEINHGRRQKTTRQQVTKPRPATKGPLAEPWKTAATRRRHARRPARGEATKKKERLVRRRKYRRRAAGSLVNGGHARES